GCRSGGSRVLEVARGTTLGPRRHRNRRLLSPLRLGAWVLRRQVTARRIDLTFLRDSLRGFLARLRSDRTPSNQAPPHDAGALARGGPPDGQGGRKSLPCRTRRLAPGEYRPDRTAHR